MALLGWRSDCSLKRPGNPSRDSRDGGRDSGTSRLHYVVRWVPSLCTVLRKTLDACWNWKRTNPGVDDSRVVVWLGG